MKQNRGFKPTTYAEWLSELSFCSKADEMITAARTAAQLNPDRKQVIHDISLVLAQMYKRAMISAGDRPMVINSIKERFNEVTLKLLKQPIEAVVDYVIRTEPSFDPKATDELKGKTPPGFLKATPTVDKDGRVRTPLGFVKKPSPAVDKDGNVRPGLGFLSD